MLEKVKKFYHQKRFDKALIIAKREFKKFPNNMEYAYLLGLIYYSLDRYNTSSKFLNLFLEKHPNQTDALIAKMHCLRSLKRDSEAIEVLNKLLILDYRKSDIHLFLGECYLKLKKKEIANEHFNKSLTIDSSKKNLLNIFNIYSNLDYRKEASYILKKSKFFKNDHDIILKYCDNQILFNLEGFTEVHKLLEKLLQSQTNNSKLFYLIAISSLILGKINNAKSYFLKSIYYFSNSSDNSYSFIFYIASSYYQLAKMSYKFNSDEISKIKNLSTQSQNNEVKALLGYALSKIYENQDNFEESAKILKSSNKNIYKNIILPKGWKIEKELTLFENLQYIYCNLKDKIEYPVSGVFPIFILGMPRSGTTLVENILSQSNLVEPTGENGFILKNILSYFPMIKNKKINFDIESPNIFLNFADNYYKFLLPKKKFITDKTPLNFLVIGLIKLLIPNAKIIFCKRNRNDNIISMYQTYFHSYSHEYSYDINSLKQYYKLHNEIIEFWNSEGINFYHLNYEQLINNPYESIKKLCSFIEIDYSNEMLNSHLNKRNVYTASSFQVRQPINSNSIDKWKNYMNFFNFD